MTERTCYIVTGETETRLRALLEQHRTAQKAWWDFAKKHGSDRMKASGGSISSLGWPGARPEGWNSKGTPDRKTPLGRQFLKEFAALPDDVEGYDLKEPLGCAEYVGASPSGFGLMIRYPNAEIVGGQVVASIPQQNETWSPGPDLALIRASEYHRLKEDAAALEAS